MRRILNPFRYAYVINYAESDGYLFRAPMFVAAAFCWMVAAQARRDTRVTVRTWGHAPTPKGLLSTTGKPAHTPERADLHVA